MNPKAVTYPQLLGISGCLALALAAHLGSIPAWVLATVGVSGALRLLLAKRGRPAPPRGVRLAVAGLAITMLFLQLRTFNGLSAGTALLALMAGLKLLETGTQRDIYVVTLIIYFVSLSALLQGDSFWLLAYLIGVVWLTTATLLRLTTTLPAPNWRRCIGYAGRILSQALPIAAVFWLFFPRFAGPLWAIPDESRGAESGLSDTMSPGDIDHLALSDEVAFRVHFSGATPPSRDRYWRGPVMHDFDGRTWRRSLSASPISPPLQAQGPAVRYTVSLEPHRHRWIFTLDWPSHWDLPGAALTGDYTLMQREPVSRPIDVNATSYTRVQSSAPLNGPAAGPGYPASARTQSTLARARANSAPRPPGRLGVRERRPLDVRATALLLHAHAAEADRPFGRCISIRHQTRLLRALRVGIRDAHAGRGDTIACRNGLSGRYLQPVRGLLDRAPKRCACLGRGLDRRPRLGTHRSHVRDRPGARANTA